MRSGGWATVLGALAIGFGLAGCEADSNYIAPTKANKNARTPDEVPTGIVSKTLKDGDGEPTVVGKRVVVHYVGKLLDGTEFDSSHGRDPLAFTIGSGEVIKGLDYGVEGMRVGERRHVTIPARLGYGSKPYGKIPPDSVLVFEVDLVSFK